jgi:hypothetical protein
MTAEAGCGWYVPEADTGSSAITLTLAAPRETNRLQASVVDASGTPVSAGVTVRWVRTSGHCVLEGGSPTALDPPVGLTTTTSSSGTAQITVKNPTEHATSCQVWAITTGSRSINVTVTAKGTARNPGTITPASSDFGEGVGGSDGTIHIGPNDAWVGALTPFQNLAGGFLGACLVLLIAALALSATRWAFAHLTGSTRSLTWSKTVLVVLFAAAAVAGLAALFTWGSDLIPTVNV